MKENMLFSGESKNIEYKVTVPDKYYTVFCVSRNYDGHKPSACLYQQCGIRIRC